MKTIFRIGFVLASFCAVSKGQSLRAIQDGKDKEPVEFEEGQGKLNSVVDFKEAFGVSDGLAGALVYGPYAVQGDLKIDERFFL